MKITYCLIIILFLQCFRTHNLESFEFIFENDDSVVTNVFNGANVNVEEKILVLFYYAYSNNNYNRVKSMYESEFSLHYDMSLCENGLKIMIKVCDIINFQVKKSSSSSTNYFYFETLDKAGKDYPNIKYSLYPRDTNFDKIKTLFDSNSCGSSPAPEHNSNNTANSNGTSHNTSSSSNNNASSTNSTHNIPNSHKTATSSDSVNQSPISNTKINTDVSTKEKPKEQVNKSLKNNNLRLENEQSNKKEEKEDTLVDDKSIGLNKKEIKDIKDIKALSLKSIAAKNAKPTILPNTNKTQIKIKNEKTENEEESEEDLQDFQ